MTQEHCHADSRPPVATLPRRVGTKHVSTRLQSTGGIAVSNTAAVAAANKDAEKAHMSMCPTTPERPLPACVDVNNVANVSGADVDSSLASVNGPLAVAASLVVARGVSESYCRQLRFLEKLRSAGHRCSAAWVTIARTQQSGAKDCTAMVHLQSAIMHDALFFLVADALFTLLRGSTGPCAKVCSTAGSFTHSALQYRRDCSLSHATNSKNKPRMFLSKGT